MSVELLLLVLERLDVERREHIDMASLPAALSGGQGLAERHLERFDLDPGDVTVIGAARYAQAQARVDALALAGADPEATTRLYSSLGLSAWVDGLVAGMSYARARAAGEEA